MQMLSSGAAQIGDTIVCVIWIFFYFSDFAELNGFLTGGDSQHMVGINDIFSSLNHIRSWRYGPFVHSCHITSVGSHGVTVVVELGAVVAEGNGSHYRSHIARLMGW